METKNEKLKIDFSTVVIVIILIALIVVGGIYYLVTKNKGNESEVNAIQNNIEENTTTENETNSIAVETTKFQLSKEEYPKVDGATAMKPMSVEIAKSVLGMTKEEADKFIVHNTTAKAYENLINKKADLIFVSEPSDSILKDAKNAGVEFEMVGIGRDGFVFIVNKENKVDSLTIEQIQKIYTGEIKNWSEVGGEDEKIIAYQREQNSGSQNLMEKMVMKNLKLADVPSEFKINGMEGLIDAIASYSNAKASIGYSIYLYAKEQYVKDSIKFLSINNVYPTDDTIANGTYPLSKIVYAIYRKDEPENSNTRKLVKWLLTQEGQETVTAGGYTCIE